MFLSNGILKKLMKQAYKKGLVVAQTEERVYLAGGYWEMDVRRDYLPKQILAQIIELAGELPEVGQRFSATKEGNQIEEFMTREVDTYEFKDSIEVTKLILIGKFDTAQRILQIPAGDVFIINNAFVEIADNANVEESRGEYAVTKPLYNAVKGILWQNNVARFHASWRIDEEHERLLSEITQIDLTEDVPV